MPNNNKIFIYTIEIMFAIGIYLGYLSIDFDYEQKWAVTIARYTVYILIMKGIHEACVFACNFYQTREPPSMKTAWKRCKLYLFVFAMSVIYVLYHKQRVLGKDFIHLFVAYLIAQYPKIEQNYHMVNYGMGMAYSYYEGYLTHILPSDGKDFVGFQDNISSYESEHGVVFPVKRLFIVITKSLYCPPDLKHFNKTNADLPYLEACRSLADVEKDVAGVKNRTYRNSAYAIYRKHMRPVYLAVECATPLHTLSKVLQKKTVYDELVDVEPADLVRDFCATLRSVLYKNPESRDKCELVFYDDTDKTQNLADILLDKIRELEPDFEKMIAKRE